MKPNGPLVRHSVVARHIGNLLTNVRAFFVGFFTFRVVFFRICFGFRISDFGFSARVSSRTRPRLAPWLLVLAAATCLTGCFGFLKPARSVSRHFVLTPLPPAEPTPAAVGSLAIGVGQVKIPPYLFETSLATRKGANEIDYLPSVLWAERLDNGFQRVLAANLSSLLSTDKIRLSAWRSEDVSAEVYVAIEQFDVDTSGQGVLVAWWRVLSPGGEKTLKSGQCSLTRQGPAPDPDPSGVVATMSDLVADLSRQLAQAIKETTLTQSRGI